MRRVIAGGTPAIPLSILLNLFKCGHTTFTDSWVLRRLTHVCGIVPTALALVTFGSKNLDADIIRAGFRAQDFHLGNDKQVTQVGAVMF